MKIVVDIGHPAHVHFFKNFIWEKQGRGHKILITARDKEVALRLLDNYGFKYVNLGSGGDTLIKKIINIPIKDLKMYKAVKGFRPDLFVGVGSIRAAHVSRLMRKPCIAFDDSEPTPQAHLLYAPFSDVIITPSCFRKHFGKKHIRYNGYHELAYLHPNYFKSNHSILKELGIKRSEKFFILRFVAWKASHDVGRSGLNQNQKRKIVNLLEKLGKVFITCEKSLEKEFEKYRIKISPEKVHDILYYATMLVGDSQTMTTEAAVLGTPAVRYNSFVGPNDMGNFIELEKKYGLIYSFRDFDKAMMKIKELLKNKNIKIEWQMKREKLLKDKIDVTKWMADFVESFKLKARKARYNQSIDINREE